MQVSGGLAWPPRGRARTPTERGRRGRRIERAWNSDLDWGTLIWLSMTTDSRRGEVCGLRWHRLDLNSGLTAGALCSRSGRRRRERAARRDLCAGGASMTAEDGMGTRRSRRTRPVRALKVISAPALVDGPGSRRVEHGSFPHAVQDPHLGRLPAGYPTGREGRRRRPSQPHAGRPHPAQSGRGCPQASAQVDRGLALTRLP